MEKIKSVIDIIHKYNVILTPSQKRWGVVVIIMTVIGAFLETLGISVVLPLAQTMLEPQKLYENTLITPIIEGLGIESASSLIWIMGGTVIAVYLFKNLFLLLLSYVRIKYACKVQRELSCEMMEAYIRRGYLYFLEVETGELVRGVSVGINNAYTGLYQSFKLFSEFLTIIFICGYVMYTDFALSLTVMGTVLICLFVVLFICQKWVKKYGEMYYRSISKSNKNVLHTFQGIKEILVGRRERYFLDKHKNNYVEMQRGLIGQTICGETPTYLIETTCVAGLILAIGVKTMGTSDASLVIPELAAFVVAAFRILPSLGRISNNFNQIIFSLPGVNDVYKNFSMVRKNTIEEDDIKQKSRENLKMSLQNCISLENISWKYPNSESRVLNDISLNIYKGEAVAFIGKSGAGKTTLVDIVLGLFRAESGDVKIDGISIKEIPEQWSHIIGFVSQDINLLNGSIRENIAFGIKDDKIKDEMVWDALEQAQLKDLVKQYPKGLDTEIGERGIRLSGGQRQRIAIARALYSNPDILVLDEATSALDSETETAVMDAIESLQGKKTLIIVAHRLTTIKSCDKIYEISDGKIIERKYEDLVQE